MLLHHLISAWIFAALLSPASVLSHSSSQESPSSSSGTKKSRPPKYEIWKKRIDRIDKILAHKLLTLKEVNNFLITRKLYVRKYKRDNGKELIPAHPTPTIVDAKTARQKPEERLKKIDTLLKKGVMEIKATKLLERRKKISRRIIELEGTPPPAPQPKIISKEEYINQLLGRLEKIDNAIMKEKNEEKIAQKKIARNNIASEITSLGGEAPPLKEAKTEKDGQQLPSDTTSQKTSATNTQTNETNDTEIEDEVNSIITEVDENE